MWGKWHIVVLLNRDEWYGVNDIDVYLTGDEQWAENDI